MSMAIGTRGLRPPLRDVQQDAPFCLCERCQGEVYCGEKLYRWDGKRLCPDCFTGEVESWLHRAPEEVAYALGTEVEETEPETYFTSEEE